LKLITISEEQQSRKDIKVVYKLPKSVKSVSKLLKDHRDADKLLIVQRIRDYYNPIIEPQYAEEFKQFVVCLLQFYASLGLEDEAVMSHLQELCSQHGDLFSAFLQSKIRRVVEVLKELRSLDEKEDIGKVLMLLRECQIVTLKVLECPNNSKLLEILEQATGHVYAQANFFIDRGNIDGLKVLVANDIAICAKLHKKFNPALSMICLKLQDKALTKAYLKTSLDQLPWSSVLTSDFTNILGPRSGAPLEHLRLQAKKPKELPSFNPMIDEEFMAAVMDDAKFKKKETERDIKRKTKRAEKDALRELRKDTVQI